MDCNILESKFKPIIKKLINDNKKFYGFEKQINWNFFINEDIGLVATNNYKLELKVNILAVDYAYKNKQPIMIEFFILHEIRHIYQRYFAYLLKTNECPNIPLAKQYNKEFSNYCNLYQNREIYYSQQIEFEAYVFSYSVIKYKYGHVDYIHYPTFYDEQNVAIEKYVNHWLDIFKNQNL